MEGWAPVRLHVCVFAGCLSVRAVRGRADEGGTQTGEPAKLAPGALPMFKPGVKALSAEAVGKYALQFSLNDKHDLGIFCGSICGKSALARSVARRPQPLNGLQRNPFSHANAGTNIQVRSGFAQDDKSSLYVRLGQV